ncbi:MAG: dihydrolipoamide acetyltransferase family protein [Opitutales bacterium]|nr:dihydrolipoamide acetyltransferase family protein [Opitutales bacterium]
MAVFIEMPKLSDTMTTGTVVKWHKQAGDIVTNGDIIAEIETDKATMELENFDDGVLLKIFASEGDEIDIGKPLAVVGEEGEEIPAIEELPLTANDTSASDNSIDLEKDVPSPAPSVVEVSPPAKDVKTDNARIMASPLAKKMAKELNIDLSDITGTGPRGRITRKDVTSKVSVSPSEKASTSTLGLPSPVAQNSIKLVSKEQPVSKMRSVIARRLLESKTTIPHFYLQKEINARPLRLAKEAINLKLSYTNSSPESVQKVSINDLILKACADSIPQVPEINTSWTDDHISFHGEVCLAFGVAVEDGLVTPVIQNANHMSLIELASSAKSLIEKARSKKISPNEMSGSTFTVTNLGMFGIDFFSGIINPPNAAILSVGASQKKPVVSDDGEIVVGERMVLGLSCDHRLVDGAIGATFLQILAGALECPASLLV